MLNRRQWLLRAPRPSAGHRAAAQDRGARRGGRWRAACAGLLTLGVVACGPSARVAPAAPAAPAPGSAASESPADGPAAPTAAGASTASAPTSAPPRAPDRIRMSYSATSFAFLSMFAAQDQGFYARNGLDAELVQAAATVSIAGMVNGDVDFSMSLGSFARAAAKGLPVRVLEESGTAPQLYLVARPELRSMADLRGRVLSPISMGGTNSQTATLLLRKHGVDPQSVQLLAGGDAPRQLEMLRQGQIDAALISPPYPLIAQREGYTLLANAQQEIALAFTGVVASLDTLAQRGDLVRRTIRAEIEALQYLHGDREGTIRLMEQRFSAEPELAAAAYDQIIGAFTTDGSVSREGVEQVMALDKEEGEIPESAQFEDVVDLRPLQDVQRAMGLAR
ncbi:MAG TPA: ABC transporter substrate-binding protein [Chloroflexota bacterium]|nr:ABC transporter substrate-binding protein [Chloroflexota bacterium]